MNAAAIQFRLDERLNAFEPGQQVDGGGWFAH